MTDIRNPVNRVRYLDGGSNVAFEQRGDRLFLRGLSFSDSLATTLVVEVEGEPETTMAQTSHWIPG